MTTMTAQRHLLRDLRPRRRGAAPAARPRATPASADPLRFSDALRGRSVACYFSKPSTRTRVSFEAAAWRLGMLPIMLRPDELQLGRGEPISDTARVLVALLRGDRRSARSRRPTSRRSRTRAPCR